MKIQFLGTAAAEGIPAIFCTCANCRKSREAGGRSLRTRSQAIVDDSLLIDFPADTLAHLHANRLDLSSVTDCIITHNHGDHFYPTDIHMLEPSFSHMQDGYKLVFHGSDKVGEGVTAKITPKMINADICAFSEIKAFETQKIGRYQVTALPALHDRNSGPLFYMISGGGKTFLYGHDTNFFSDEVWAYFAGTKPHFDAVSLDCTNSCSPMTYIGHMSLAENAKTREIMLEKGYADENTVFVSNHFSHNGKNSVYDEFVPIAAKEGFIVSFDGMVLYI